MCTLSHTHTLILTLCHTHKHTLVITHIHTYYHFVLVGINAFFPLIFHSVSLKQAHTTILCIFRGFFISVFWLSFLFHALPHSHKCTPPLTHTFILSISTSLSLPDKHRHKHTYKCIHTLPFCILKGFSSLFLILLSTFCIFPFSYALLSFLLSLFHTHTTTIFYFLKSFLFLAHFFFHFSFLFHTTLLFLSLSHSHLLTLTQSQKHSGLSIFCFN